MASSGKTSASGRRRKTDPGRNMIPRLLILVFIFIAVFEGNMIRTLLTHKVSSSASYSVKPTNTSTTISVVDSDESTAPDSTPDASGSSSSGTISGGEVMPDSALAGLAAVVTGSSISAAGSDITASDTASDQAQKDQTQSDESAASSGEQLDSSAVVPAADTAVDDSYFRNAVFIGDSRMEGFRNASGITQGTFLTGVGLSIGDMDKQIISTSDGKISVYQGLSGIQYDRIYLMLGTNDLGFYPWEDFQPLFEKVIKQFHDLQPNAIIYVCSVIYVEESKIAPGFEYDNNENVMKINSYILSTCEDLWYSCYINLNEIFSDGSHGLISGASADGIHLEPEYCEEMLEYLKSHYIPDEQWTAIQAENGAGDASGSIDSAGESSSEASSEESSEDTGDISAG